MRQTENHRAWGRGIWRLLVIAAFAGAYFLASQLGFALAFTAEQVTVVWPPSGLALAAVLLLGDSILPGVALGAFLANITRHEPLITALGICIGNTSEAWIAALLMRRLTAFSPTLGRMRDVLSLVFFSALCGTMLCANIGVLTLCATGVQPWASYGKLWLLWWLGDATGVVVLAPVLMVWLSKPRRHFTAARTAELACLLLSLIAICMVIFVGAPRIGMRGQLFIYVIFPFIIFSTLRFGQYGGTLVTLFSSSIAIVFAARGVGPFMFLTSPEESLLLLQVFMGVVAVTALCLGAAITERRRAADSLALVNLRKNEFLATLGHELRNPLSTISNALHVASAPGMDAAKTAEAHAVMRRQLNQIGRLIEDLLDVSRIAHGKVELRKEKVALSTVIMTALDTVKPAMQANNHRLGMRLPPKTVWLDADPARLTQIFVNLLGNSAKYTPAGGEIVISAGVENNQAVIRVSDNGIGISPSLLPHIFDMFMQADAMHERAQGGLGIGLTLVKRLAEMHGGQVSASSGGSFKGSEFTLRLPVAEAPAKAAQEPAKTQDRITDAHTPSRQLYG